MAIMRLSLALCLLAIIGVHGEKDPKTVEKDEKKKVAKLPPCGACTALVGSFEAGMKRTARGKLEGGDTSWEEKNQAGGYANSEVRFVEIQEALCKDLYKGEDQCHKNHHDWEEHLETWWKSDEDARKSLKQYLCVETLQSCCEDNHYGPDCKECSMINPDSGKLCSGNGKCKGSGTRKGNGKCACDKGYMGELCNECGLGYFESYKDTEKLLCSECHKSCQDHCTGAGPKSCANCKTGYMMHTEHGCQDVDECHQETQDACQMNQFCVNTEGSHKCFDCDKGCKTCFADGPDSCNECADDYVMQPHKAGADEGSLAGSEGVCVTKEAAGRMFSISNTRFFTYGGLCVATCIIFQRSAYIAGFLGLVIAMYISLSEYYLQDATGELRPISV